MFRRTIADSLGAGTPGRYVLAGAVRAFVVIQNTSAGAGTYTLYYEYNATDYVMVSGVAIAAGANAFINLPNDVPATPLPLPDVLAVQATVAVDVRISIDR